MDCISNFETGGIDVGLIVLTNTNKKYGNKFYYNPVSNKSMRDGSVYYKDENVTVYSNTTVYGS